MTDDVLEQMRRDWDERARRDSWSAIADVEAVGLRFALSGLRDSYVLLEDVHEHLPEETRVLEIGCGVGRMLRFLALIFREVHGVDVSPEMIREAHDYLSAFPNAHPAVGDGQSLGQYEDGFFHLVYSYVVFQHIPDPDVIRSYIGEARRVLAPGGVFKFLIKTKPWDGEPGLDTWNGATVDLATLAEWNRELGFEVLRTQPADEWVTWVTTRAPADA
ncbi:MAG: class I SAM-dependent methyltransferase [Planctomycetota bacterium]